LTQRRDAARINRVRLPWQPEDYARTCGKCGYTWRVPRSAARRRIRSISAFLVAPNARSIDRRELARQVESISMEKEAVEVFRHCPECGSDQFTQHAARDHPAG
jgi:ribosomal protein S27AE